MGQRELGIDAMKRKDEGLVRHDEKRKKRGGCSMVVSAKLGLLSKREDRKSSTIALAMQDRMG